MSVRFCLFEKEMEMKKEREAGILSQATRRSRGGGSPYFPPFQEATSLRRIVPTATRISINTGILMQVMSDGIQERVISERITDRR